MSKGESMNIQILFFGAMASVVGTRNVEISLPNESTAEMAVVQMKSTFPKLSGHKLLYSLNQNYATGGEIVREGDEIAIFTAVSGG